VSPCVPGLMEPETGGACTGGGPVFSIVRFSILVVAGGVSVARARLWGLLDASAGTGSCFSDHPAAETLLGHPQIGGRWPAFPSGDLMPRGT
jgi:hypothetical protein